jgi:hypothetical protein
MSIGAFFLFLSQRTPPFFQPSHPFFELDEGLEKISKKYSREMSPNHLLNHPSPHEL